MLYSKKKNYFKLRKDLNKQHKVAHLADLENYKLNKFTSAENQYMRPFR